MRTRTFVGAAFAGLLCASSPALASPYIVTLDEVGSDVVATGSGQIDLTGLSFYVAYCCDTSPLLAPSGAEIRTGSGAGGNLSQYTGPVGPTSFGSGSLSFGSSGSGDVVWLAEGGPGVIFYLSVPQGYVSDAALANTSTFNGATFASLGATPGTYMWTWGSGADQSFTLQIGPVSAVPLPATLPLFASGLAGLGWLGRRRRKTPAEAAH